MEVSDLPPIPLPPPVPPDRTHAAARKKRARRNLIVLIVAVIVAAGGLWWLESTSSLPFANLASLGNSIANEVSANFSSYPSPLTLFTNTSKAKAKLTASGVIAGTNQQRAANGNLPPLTENPTLDDIAVLRLDDMFENQYFAHVSPTGQSAETVASSVGYQHIALGENLAEGIFAGNAGLMTAWMNSPGHRANILNTHYDQIGVAVREGTFQGKDAWIAVQIFGRPASDCPAPDATLEATITTTEGQLSTMNAQLQNQKADIEATQPQSGSTYNAKVEQYNALVGQYNDLGNQVKTEVAQYNAQVNAFNQCLGE
jgi:uncharacterized protein YkwD